nr:hypothetical protein Iba_chr15aCG13360 [Ipomoea batatas]
MSNVWVSLLPCWAVTSKVRYRGAVGQLNGRIIGGAEIEGEGSFATVVSVASGESGVDVSVGKLH